MAANKSFSGLGAALRGDFAGAASSQVYGDELNEEDVWGVADEPAVEEREPPDDLRSEDNEPPPPAQSSVGRVINRTGWVTTSTPLSGFNRGKGLSALAAEGIHGSGQGPGTSNVSGGAGDILGTAVGATSSVFIPSKAPSKADALRPMRRASAPVNVPDWSRITGSSRTPAQMFAGDDDDEDTVVPPHELVARDCAKSVTFSVYEGVGRTLRGRDLDHIRTEILRKTGFLDE